MYTYILHLHIKSEINVLLIHDFPLQSQEQFDVSSITLR